MPSVSALSFLSRLFLTWFLMAERSFVYRTFRRFFTSKNRLKLYGRIKKYNKTKKKHRYGAFSLLNARAFL